MSSEAAARLEMTLEEFLRWTSDGDARYQLLEGRAVAMTPPSSAHGTIVSNLARRIGERLDRLEHCRLVTEGGILSPTKEDTYYQADLVVTCTAHHPGEQHIAEPLMIVEVLSPSTEDHDRKVKVADYRKCSSVQEILLVDQSKPYCEIHRRFEADQDRWLVDLYLSLEETLSLESLGVELPLEAIYAKLSLD